VKLLQGELLTVESAREAAHGELLSLDLALRALGCAIRSVEEEEPTAYGRGRGGNSTLNLQAQQVRKLQKYAGLTTFMRLDKAAFQALHIFPGANNGVTSGGTGGRRISQQSRSESVFDFLNRCKSRPGTRLLRAWLRQPLTDMQAIKKRHALFDV